MTNKKNDINTFVDYLAATGMQPILRDDLWKVFGYKKRPKKGAVISKMFSKKYALDNFIFQEVLMMCLINILNAIKKSDKDEVTKYLLSLGALDRFIEATKHSIEPNDFFNSLILAYKSFLERNSQNTNAYIIKKAKNNLNKKDFAKFIVGIAQLATQEDYFIKTDIIKDKLNGIDNFENKLKISMPELSSDKYSKVLLTKIIRA